MDQSTLQDGNRADVPSIRQIRERLMASTPTVPRTAPKPKPTGLKVRSITKCQSRKAMPYLDVRTPDGELVYAPSASTDNDERHILTDAVESFLAAPECQVNWCIFLNASGVRITVDKANELALLIAKYLSSQCPLVQPTSEDDGMLTMDISGGMDLKAIQGLRAALGAKGFKFDEDRIYALIDYFGEFLEQCYKDEENIQKKEMEEEKSESRGNDKTSKKETGDVVETKELDGHSWGRKFLPANGFWGC